MASSFERQTYGLPTRAVAEHLDPEEAQRRVEHTDAEHEKFHRLLFDRVIDDPLAYDLVLNTQDIDIDGSAAVVAEAFRRKFHQQRR